MGMHHEKSIGGKATVRLSGPASEYDQHFPRILEIAAAMTILLCLAPVLLISAIAVRLGSGGPIFVREKRSNSRKQPVQVFRFRLAAAETQGTSSQRLTRVGVILTETGISELPQFFNVLRGEVSFVEVFKSLS
jgi:lipopolysaccharide/colanic/teichoic acid biosynthesis glycosyltransferase